MNYYQNILNPGARHIPRSTLTHDVYKSYRKKNNL